MTSMPGINWTCSTNGTGACTSISRSFCGPATACGLKIQRRIEFFLYKCALSVIEAIETAKACCRLVLAGTVKGL